MPLIGSIVKMDKLGRITIPASIRRKLDTNLFILELEGDNIILKPIQQTSLTSLFDTIKVEVEDFTGAHELRKALLKDYV